MKIFRKAMGGQMADQNALMQQQYGLAGQYAALNQQLNQQAAAATFPGKTDKFFL
jgi:hypothetical protein